MFHNAPELLSLLSLDLSMGCETVEGNQETVRRREWHYLHGLTILFVVSVDRIYLLVSTHVIRHVYTKRLQKRFVQSQHAAN